MNKQKHRKHSIKRVLYLGMLCAIMCTALFACSKSRQKEKQRQEAFTEELEAGGRTESEGSASKTGQDALSTSAGSGAPASWGQSEKADPATADPDAGGQSQEEKPPVTVYICGQVRTPGVYELPAGSRICDAVEKAGGMTADAAQEYWNLAEELSDGDMIYVPDKEEAADRQESLYWPEESSSSGKESTDGRININRASREELTGIPGVGEVRADMIIAYRKEHGAFATTYDITGIPGIGDATYEKMKDKITVD